ncbi:hypothetical protein [Ensifer soli]|uniref:hypothetical protein n=1 Tax=Ciceribacter sp. sgz301302 TaxID=3342379 RepID=UPI0035B744F4
MMMPILSPRSTVATAAVGPVEAVLRPQGPLAPATSGQTALRILAMLDRQVANGEPVAADTLMRILEALAGALKQAPAEGAAGLASRIAAFVAGLPPELRRHAERQLGLAPPAPDRSAAAGDDEAETSDMPHRPTSAPAARDARPVALGVWAQIQSAFPGMVARAPAAPPERLQSMLRDTFGGEEGEIAGDHPEKDDTSDDGAPRGDAQDPPRDGGPEEALSTAQVAEEVGAGGGDDLLDTDGTYRMRSATVPATTLATLSVCAGVRAEAGETPPAASAGPDLEPARPRDEAPAIGLSAIHRASEAARRARIRPASLLPGRDIGPMTAASYDFSAERAGPATPQYDLGQKRDAGGRAQRRDLPEAPPLPAAAVLSRDAAAADVYELYRMLGGLG